MLNPAIMSFDTTNNVGQDTNNNNTNNFGQDTNNNNNNNNVGQDTNNNFGQDATNNFGQDTTNNNNFGQDNNNFGQNDMVGSDLSALEVGNLVSPTKKSWKLSKKNIVLLVIVIVVALVVLGLIGLVVYYSQKSTSNQSATCTAGSGTTCTLTNNSFACTANIGSNTQVVDNTIQPSEAVCPAGCTLSDDYACGCASGTCVAAHGVIDSTSSGTTTFSVDSANVCPASGGVTWDAGHATCKATPGAGTCTSCKPQTQDLADPTTWVTCNDKQCQGSLQLNVGSNCQKPLGNARAKASGNVDTAGVDFAGMFTCIKGGGNNCSFDSAFSQCANNKCPAFSMNSDTNKQIEYQACSNTSTATNNGSVMIAPFGNSLTTGKVSKLPGW